MSRSAPGGQNRLPWLKGLRGIAEDFAHAVTPERPDRVGNCARTI